MQKTRRNGFQYQLPPEASARQGRVCVLNAQKRALILSEAMKIQNPFLTALTALCALGAGITGTLLWVENRPAAPVAMTESAAPKPSTPLPVPLSGPAFSGTADSGLGAPAGQVTQGGSQVPPANLTSGMSPPEAALALGNWNYDHEKWDEAIQNYQSAIRDGVDNPNVHTDLGNALRFNDRPQDALKQYQIAQKQDPTHEQSLFNQGALYAVSLKNPRKGVEAWRAYLKRFPSGGSAAKAREFVAQYARVK